VANPATTADLVSRWRPLSAQEETNGATFLADAWGMLRRHFTLQGVDLDASIASDADLNADVVRVLATAVLRVMKNPDGKVREAIDDYSWARDEATASGALYFSDDELDSLVPGSGSTGRAFSVNQLAGWDSA
jgi:hypothetical protein